MNKNSYHNTVPVNGQTLIDFEQKAKSLEDEIMRFFKNSSRKEITTEDFIMISVKKKNVKSVSRAFTNLKNKSFIEMTGNKVQGSHGSQINTWRLCDQDNSKIILQERIRKAKNLYEKLTQEYIQKYGSTPEN